ncbi:hypothetical protein D3C71_1768330 [compost metagenome]
MRPRNHYRDISVVLTDGKKFLDEHAYIAGMLQHIRCVDDVKFTIEFDLHKVAGVILPAEPFVKVVCEYVIAVLLEKALVVVSP